MARGEEEIRKGRAMEFEMKKAVVTGGSGPVGRALIRKLLEENVEVLFLYRKESDRSKWLPAHKLLRQDCCSLQELSSYMPDAQDYDVFFHLGWANTFKTDREDLKMQNENVAYTCDAAELAHRFGCHTFLGSGSQAEYGRHMEALRPDTLCIPESAYGVMKLCACHASRVICRKYGMRHMWPRILSGYGYYDNVYSVLISTIVNSLNGRSPVFSKGEQIWDFVYMDDIANALFLIARKGTDGVCYPIGSGDAKPLKEYLIVLCEKLGNMEKAEFGALPYGDSQIMHLEADISRLQTDTGWRPLVSFEEGITRTIEFYRKRLAEDRNAFATLYRKEE